MKKTDKGENGIYEYAKENIAPVLHAYMVWVLEEAQKQGITTLYFLARDGYVLQEIAQMLCEKKKLPIVCRYLYCSRAALRMPCYHLIGEEAFSLLFLGGYHVTLKSFFERAEIPETMWTEILEEIGLDGFASWEEELSPEQILFIKEAFRGSEIFYKALSEHSKQAYQTAIGYLKQEGLLEQEIVAIVDSGWTGSMQRSLRQLLQSAGYSGRIQGFYFGLFNQQKEAKDGVYQAWYFEVRSHRKNKILFCNNLLEIFLSAPHGMTASYEKVGEKFVPLLKKEAKPGQYKMILDQINGIIAGVRKQMEQGVLWNKKMCEHRLYRIMAHPQREEVKLYGTFVFCDDVTEHYNFALAAEEQCAYLKERLLLVMLLKKWKRKYASKKKYDGKGKELFWAYGTIALVKNPFKRLLYQWNEYLFQGLRMIR